MKTRSLMFGSLGNGITVSDRLHEKHGDYEHIAHIDRFRNIKWYTHDLTSADFNKIETYARTADPSISTTQPDRKIFDTRPE